MQERPLETTPFVTAEPGKRRAPGYRAERRSVGRAYARRRVRGGSMWAKIGICSLVLLAVILIELVLLSGQDASIETGNVPSVTAHPDEETLGKLQYVQANGVHSVFSGSQRWSMPVDATAAEILTDTKVLCLTAGAESRVSVPASGEVREIGSDAVYGAFVRISHGNGLESVYYNIESISVEKGQPLSALDTLGTVPEDGKVYVTVTQSGMAQLPDTFIDVTVEG